MQLFHESVVLPPRVHSMVYRASDVPVLKHPYVSSIKYNDLLIHHVRLFQFPGNNSQYFLEYYNGLQNGCLVCQSPYQRQLLRRLLASLRLKIDLVSPHVLYHPVLHDRQLL